MHRLLHVRIFPYNDTDETYDVTSLLQLRAAHIFQRVSIVDFHCMLIPATHYPAQRHVFTCGFGLGKWNGLVIMSLSMPWRYFVIIALSGTELAVAKH
jgi:hypothetical protein